MSVNLGQQLQPTSTTAPAPHWAARIALLAILVGCAARLWVFSHRGSLWLDEASLALNVHVRDFAGLARPLDWGQAAPVGFLWLQKVLTVALGPAEWVLRLVPLLAGVATLWLAWRAGRRLVGAPAAALAVTALACSLLAIRYSAEARPYASDAVVALALVSLALDVLDAPDARRRWTWLGVAGAVGVLVSLPSAFVLAAIGVALLPDVLRQGRAVRLVALVGVVAWLAVFGALWVLTIGEASGGAYLREYWAPVMLDLRAKDFVARLIRAAASGAATPLQWTGSVEVALACVGAWLAGVVVIAWRSWRHAMLVAGPFAIAALASMAGVYPLSDRLAFFAAPLTLLAVTAPFGDALAWVGQRLDSRAERAATLAMAAVAGAWVGTDGMRVVRAPGSLEPTHALFASVRADAARTGTPVYVFARAVPEWVYATTDWRSPDRDRLARYLALAGATDAPAHENLARSRALRSDEGDTLVVRADGVTELVGLAPGVRYRIAGPTSAYQPTPGWPIIEANRIARAVDAARSPSAPQPSVWVVASHFFEGTDRDELMPLGIALQERGLRVVEERRGARDAVAVRMSTAPADSVRR